MSIPNAELSFNQGMAALAQSHHADAVECFRQAIEILRQRNVEDLDARYLSYYGLSLALSGRASTLAVASSQAAVEREPAKPTYLLNLGRVYLATGKANQALACFCRGVCLAPDYRPLLEELGRMDRRARRVLRRPSGRVFGRAVAARCARVLRRRGGTGK